MQVIFLGAGAERSARVGAISNDELASLSLVDGRARALDWNLRNYRQCGASAIRYVAGFRAAEVIRNYPDLEVVVNPLWKQTHTLGSLSLLMPLSSEDVVVQYADTLFRPSIIHLLQGYNADVVCAVDCGWKSRPLDQAIRARAEKVVLVDGRVVRSGRQSIPVDSATGQLTGLILLRERAITLLNNLFAVASLGKAFYDSPALMNASLADLLSYLIDKGIEIRAIDCRSEWAELDTPHDLAAFVLGTKAQTLERLSGVLRHSIVDPHYIVPVEAWAKEMDRILREIREQLPYSPLIVRSSAQTEDGWQQSNAGAFDSVANVDPLNRVQLTEAIQKVISSLTPGVAGNQVLVQKQITKPLLSGVAFTRNSSTGAPYYIINYAGDEMPTDAVTSGRLSDLKTAVVLRKGATTVTSSPLRELVIAFSEIEECVGYDSLDIEFAVDQQGVIHTLQVRPLVGCLDRQTVLDQEIEREVFLAHEFVAHKLHASVMLPGRRSLLADMPDWNPAEIIGINPSPLANSLYKQVVTNEVWAASRSHFGYSDVRPIPLMVNVIGHPYIDLRVSFNSFIPAALPPALKTKLADYYIDALAANPSLHDKIEFEIAFTCLTSEFRTRSQRLLQLGFTTSEVGQLCEALTDITLRAIGERGNGVDEDLACMEKLAERRFRMLERPANNIVAILDQIQFLIRDMERLGTLPFSNLARSAFIATAMLRSFVGVGVLQADDLDAFLLSVHTVAGDLSHDTELLNAGQMSQKEFLDRYGHLRPGTYDLRTPSYAENPELYFISRSAKAATQTASVTRKEFALTEATRKQVQAELARFGFGLSADDFFNFCRKAIAGRESSKFEFTKNLSTALSLIRELGGHLGLSAEDVALLDVSSILALHTNGVRANEAECLRELVEMNRSRQRVAESIMLPHILSDASEVFCFEIPACHPNYVTRKSVTAPLVVVDRTQPQTSLDATIALVTNADPGFDWLFSHALAGLITIYGGANSHMAIRCAEFGLPAAIGIGDLLANHLATANVVHLDCLHHRLLKVS